MSSRSTTELLTTLGISQATYYRLKKSGELQSRLSSSFITCHTKDIQAWQYWRGSGLHSKPWSNITRINQTYQLKRFLSRFPTVSAEHLETWLAELTPMQQSSRQDRHTRYLLFLSLLAGSGTPE
jgi:hypothetical protein